MTVMLIVIVRFIFPVSDAVHLTQEGNERYDSPNIFNECWPAYRPCYALRSIESTDRGSEKHLHTVVRYMTQEHTFRICFFACENVLRKVETENVRYLTQSKVMGWDTFHTEQYVQAMTNVNTIVPGENTSSLIRRSYCFARDENEAGG